MNTFSTTPTLNFVSLAVKDMAASLRFYRQLGLDIPTGADHEMHVRFTFSNGMTMAWDDQRLYQELHPDWKPSVGGPQLSFALQCANPSAVDDLYSDFDSRGCGYHEPFDAPWGMRYATLRDPDANLVDLYAPL